jgi:hypothetical protein
LDELWKIQKFDPTKDGTIVVIEIGADDEAAVSSTHVVALVVVVVVVVD